MSLKIKDFAKTDTPSEKISTKEEEPIDESDDDIQYEAPSARQIPRKSPPTGSENVPRNVEDEKPWFGPRDREGNITVKYPSNIEGYKVNNHDYAKMESMGLPTGFSFGAPGFQDKQKKGDKKTFWCEICLVELNSLDTMTSHVKGVKHMKKQLQIDEEKEKQYRRGDISKQERESGPRVIPVPNPEPTKKKVPVRLHEKIKETRDPVVGLDFIKEWIPVSDPEMEPHYECKLCGNQGIANGMFSHIMGHKHRQRFVEELHKDDPTPVMGLSPNELLNYAHKHSENNDNLSERIKTMRSDEEYPWPPGKAPWALERGGTGIPPDRARENWGKNSNYDKDVKPVFMGKVYNGDKRSSGGLPSLSSLKTPDNSEEAIKMIALGEKMLTLGMEFAGKRINQKEKSLLQTCLTAIVEKMKSKRGIVTKNGHHSPPREKSSGEKAQRGVKKMIERNSRSPSPPPVKRRRDTDTRSSSSSSHEVVRRESSNNGAVRGESRSNGSRSQVIDLTEPGPSWKDDRRYVKRERRESSGDRGAVYHDDRRETSSDRRSYRRRSHERSPAEHSYRDSHKERSREHRY